MNVSTLKSPLYVFLAISAITLVALLIRIYRLGDLSLWYDEGATLRYAMGGPKSWISDNHPPLYYALVNFWLRFGQSDHWLRLLSVIPAVATIPLIFDLGRKMFGINAGLLAAFFMALLAFHIDLSQQARMYTFLVLFYAFALWALVTAAREGQRWHWVTYTIAAILLAYTQGIGILYVAIVASLFPLISPRPLQVSAWAPFVLANSVVVLLYVPWLTVLIDAHFLLDKIGYVERPAWSKIPQTLITFVNGNIPIDGIVRDKLGIPLPSPVTIALFTAPTILIAYVALRRTFSSGHWKMAATAVSALALPLLSVYLLSVLVTPMYLDRALLPAAVGLVLILGASVQETRKTTPLLYSLILTGLLISGLNTYYFFKYRGAQAENHRLLSQDLQRSVGPGDLILFVADSTNAKFLVEYYDSERKLATARKLDLQESLGTCHGTLDHCLGGYFEVFQKSHRVWIVYIHDHTIRWTERKALQRWLDNHFTTVTSKAYNTSLLRLSEARAAGF